MMCGSPSMLDQMRLILTEAGCVEGKSNEPGHFVIEMAFVEK